MTLTGSGHRPPLRRCEVRMNKMLLFFPTWFTLSVCNTMQHKDVVGWGSSDLSEGAHGGGTVSIAGLLEPNLSVAGLLSWSQAQRCIRLLPHWTSAICKAWYQRSQMTGSPERPMWYRKHLSLPETHGILKKSCMCADGAAMLLLPAPACREGEHTLVSLRDLAFHFNPINTTPSPLPLLVAVFP